LGLALAVGNEDLEAEFFLFLGLELIANSLS